MSADWPLIELGELATEITVGFVGLMTHEYVDDGVPFFRSKNISEYEIDWNDIRYISKDFHQRLKKSVLRPGDVVIVRTGKPGTACVIPDSIEEANCSDVVIVRVNNDKLSAHYLSYFMNSVASYQVSSHLVGAVQQHFNVGSAKKIKIPLPTRDEQEEIVTILKALDDKRKLNRQINQILESIAQAIFKNWFVDFDPVKAKIAAIKAGEDAGGVTRAAMRAISGKTDNELDQMQARQPENYAQLKATAELFPSAMQETELGEVPEGWEVSTIGDEVEVMGGGTPSTKNPEFWDGGEIHWTTPKDLSNLSDKVLLTTDRKITDAGLKEISSRLLPINTVLMSSRAPVGYLALAKVPVAVNQGYIAMLCDKRLSPEFVIQWCNSMMDEIKQRSSGTTFAEISKKNFKGIPLIVPIEGIQQSYSELASGLYNKIAETALECKILADIRDSLLPKLLSGELSVDAVELVEEN